MVWVRVALSDSRLQSENYQHSGNRNLFLEKQFSTLQAKISASREREIGKKGAEKVFLKHFQ